MVETQKGNDMQAIQVKYLRPTDARSTRLKASCASGSITIPYNYEYGNAQTAYREAAEALCARLDFKLEKPLLGGQISVGVYVFIFDNQEARL